MRRPIAGEGEVAWRKYADSLAAQLEAAQGREQWAQDRALMYAKQLEELRQRNEAQKDLCLWLMRERDSLAAGTPVADHVTPEYGESATNPSPIDPRPYPAELQGDPVTPEALNDLGQPFAWDARQRDRVLRHAMSNQEAAALVDFIDSLAAQLEAAEAEVERIRRGGDLEMIQNLRAQLEAERELRQAAESKAARAGSTEHPHNSH